MTDEFGASLISTTLITTTRITTPRITPPPHLHPPHPHLLPPPPQPPIPLPNPQVPFSFVSQQMAQVHGIAVWFDCRFPGSTREILLSTSPSEPLTHWYQVRFMLRSPIACGAGHTLNGHLSFEANDARGYNVKV